MMFSTPSYGEWTKVSSSVSGDTYYVDFERIRKHDGYVYFWSLRDSLKPHPSSGFISHEAYSQGDCKLFRYKRLSYSFHKEPMGEGTGDLHEPFNKGWQYPPPDSSQEAIIQSVCNH